MTSEDYLKGNSFSEFDPELNGKSACVELITALTAVEMAKREERERLMAHLIDKSALVAEIKRKKDICKKVVWDLRTQENKDYYQGKAEAYSEMAELINTLEVKEVDLEEKATQLSQKYFPDEENIWARANIEAQNCKSACIEMVEWFKAQKG